MQIFNLVSIIEKKQIVQTSYGQKQALQITIMQEYCIHRIVQTEKKSNGNPTV